MSFHPDKCFVLSHSRKREKSTTSYTLHGQVLSQVSSTDYLGVIVQDNGEWQEHINKIATKGNQLLAFLKRNIKVNNIAVKAEAYQMLIRTPLEYASNVWDPHHQNEKDKLEKIQRRAARFVLGDYRTTNSVTTMLNTLKWPLLEDRRRENRQKMLQKILSNKVAVNHGNILEPTGRSRRSHPYQLKVIQCNRDYRNESFFPRAIREWNAMPRDFQSRDPQKFFGTV